MVGRVALCFGKILFFLWALHLSARCPCSSRPLAPAFEVSEVAGSHLHLSKLDGMFMALPVEPVNTLTVVIVPISAHQVDTVTVLVPEGPLVGQSTVGDG